MTTPPAESGPGQLRRLVRDYVLALHATYLDHVRHLPPAERAGLPLSAGRPISVAVAAARQLHLIALDRALPAVLNEPDEVDACGELRWVVRFYDPSVLPELGLIAGNDPMDVRRVLGVPDPLYHLIVEPGGGLDGHHAQHSGVALAHDHTRIGRELERLRAALPRRAAVVDEFAVCVRVGMDVAAAALARDLSGGRVDPQAGTSARATLDALVSETARR